MHACRYVKCIYVRIYVLSISLSNANSVFVNVCMLFNVRRSWISECVHAQCLYITCLCVHVLQCLSLCAYFMHRVWLSLYVCVQYVYSSYTSSACIDLWLIVHLHLQCLYIKSLCAFAVRRMVL